MTRMTGPDCAVMCNLINTHTHTHTHTLRGSMRVALIAWDDKAGFRGYVKIDTLTQDTMPFRERASGQNGRLNPLRMDITTEAGAPFDNHSRLKKKARLLDITIVNPCAGFNLGNAARHVGKPLADVVERKKNEHRGSIPATYSLLPLAMSTCGEVGSDVQVLIKELAIRRVEHKSEIHSNESQHLVEGTEVARLRRRFCFVV